MEPTLTLYASVNWRKCRFDLVPPFPKAIAANCRQVNDTASCVLLDLLTRFKRSANKVFWWRTRFVEANEDVDDVVFYGIAHDRPADALFVANRLDLNVDAKSFTLSEEIDRLRISKRHGDRVATPIELSSNKVLAGKMRAIAVRFCHGFPCHYKSVPI